ncbi:MAG: helix-turn-helix domain-containing protein [Bacteroidaceae bacterium]|nr:helix-turn-helix domain-containing protein [Bacteroidaceae bacterium]
MAAIVQSTIRAEVNKAMAEYARENKKDEPMLTKDEVCAKLRVSVPTLWKWEKSGRLVPKRAGRRVLYRESDIEAIIKK